MTIIMTAMQNSLVSFESSKTGWKTNESLKQTHPHCITIDPRNPNRAYCGTFGDGLWKTEDIGQTWNRIGKDGIASNDVTSVSVSRLDHGNKMFVGTEPTTLYRSNDRGESWKKMSALNKLKSSTSWSFPPRPWISHVRWIELDSNKSDYLYVAIEAGALVQSHDGGETWIDRVDQGPYDTHTLATHKKMPGRLYSAAGDGYFESNDYGQTWKKLVAGLEDHDYLAGLAVDSGDPETVIVSASQGAYQAHSRTAAESLVYRRISSTDDTDSIKGSDEDWKLVSKASLNHVEQSFQFLRQIQKLRENSTPSIIVGYFAPLIQGFHGKCLTMLLNGLRSIFHNILWLWQLADIE